MPRDHFSECEGSMQRNLDEIALALKFVTVSFKVSSKSGAVLGAVQGEDLLRPLLVEFHGVNLDQPAIIYQALYIQIWSAFEAFVRALLVAYLDAFTSRRADFETLEKYGLGLRNLEYTGRMLRFVRDNRRGINLDFFALAKNTSTSVPGSTKVVLNSGAFPILMAGPSAEGLRESLERIGVDLRWDDLGRVDSVQKAFGAKATRETAKQVEAFLKDAARRRNNIVHRAETSETVSESDLTSALVTFRALASALVAVLRADCQKKERLEYKKCQS